MKKVILLFALVAFLVASSAPVYATSNTNSVALAQNDEDPKKDKKAEEKSDKKSEAKSDKNCSEAKSADCCSKSKESCDTKKAEDKGKK